MRAAVFYGFDDLRMEDVPTPVPGPGEILMKNISALTCGSDLKQYHRGSPKLSSFGSKPIFGHESAGIVAAVGEGVEGFKVGDRIAPHNSAPCHKCYYCKLGITSMCEHPTFIKSAWSEYRLLPASIVRENVFHIPDNISFRSAALLEPLGSAVQGIEMAYIQLMDTVVINGAGPLGLMMAKVALLRGAYVIQTDISEYRLGQAKKLGVNETINVKEVDDQVKAVLALTPEGRGADAVIDATGLPEIWEKNLFMARKGGTVVEFGGLKGGTKVNLDATLIHYNQLNIKGTFHTTPRIVEQA